MKRTNWRFLTGLAVCTLLPAFVANAQEKVTRPLKMQAQSQQVWELANGAPVNCILVDGWGVSTHCGLFDLGVTGATSGFLTGASGDQIFYSWPPGKPFEVTITGGTGRFSEAAGEFTVNLLSLINTVDPETGLLTISLTCTASGTISY